MAEDASEIRAISAARSNEQGMALRFLTPLAPSASQLLIRHPELLSPQGRRELGALLNRFEALRAVIEFRERVQRIWDDMSANHERTLEHLCALCADAEASHILALRRFAQRLRMYALSGRSA